MGKFERGRQWPTLIRALSLPSFRFRLDPPRGSRAIAASMRFSALRLEMRSMGPNNVHQWIVPVRRHMHMSLPSARRLPGAKAGQ
jgi:hypothetical protein